MMRRKWKQRRGGVNPVVAILLALIAVMLVLIAIPGWKVFRYRSEKTACEQAMKSARDGLIIDYLAHFETGSVQQAMQTLDEVLPERANICPSGGTVYLLRGANGIYEPLCGLHDSDVKRRCRLNAARAQELLAEGLKNARRETKQEPESVVIQLNGRSLECVRVQEPPKLRRGTRTTDGYEGIVAFYGLAGEGQFAAGAVKAGEIAYFIYADEDDCAAWRAGEGWTGTAYDD